MERTSQHLSLWFEHKGFLREEIPDFITDVIQLMNRAGGTSLPLLNEELEELGWGIRILDEIAYSQLRFLTMNALMK